jgi:acyl carrier protein phosphodiesterase
MDAGVRAPKVAALGDAWSGCRKNAKPLPIAFNEFLPDLRVFAVKKMS